MTIPPPFATRLLAWFDVHGRHDLPWQHPRTPYRVWVAEIMLQQTQVATVVGYYERFMARFPDLATLAAADMDAVLALWSGLGYYARARNLQRAAAICIERHGGLVPDEFSALAALPGIGRSTAGAILAQAHGQRHPILDGNVRRVFARHRRIGGDPASPAVQAQLWAASAAALPDARLTDYTQAIMDLGASVCTRARPACERCPLRDDCAARLAGEQSSYPAPRTRRARPLRSCTQLLIDDGAGRLLLRRRPATGIWPGLWSFPEAATPEAALSSVDASLAADELQPHAQIRHEFTHYSLEIEVCRSRLCANGVNDVDATWFTREQALELGLPQPVRRIIEAYQPLP